MSDEKNANRYQPAPPIPTYEEAIGESSQPYNAQARPVDTEPALPAERQGLLGAELGGRTPIPTRRQGYRPPPTVSNNTSRGGSLDGVDGPRGERASFLGAGHADDDDDDDDDDRRMHRHSQDEEDEVRREMEEMEIMEPPSAGRSSWGKRISSLSQSLSAINLPFKLPRLHFHFHFNFNLRQAVNGINADICAVFGRIFAIALVVAIIYVLFMSDIFTSAGRRMGGQMFDPESVRIHVQNMPDERRIAFRLKQLTETDHLAGTEGDYVAAEYVQGVFVNSGLEDVHLDEFDVYLNYPKPGGRKVEILNSDGSVSWAAKIEEDPMYADPPRQETPVFHGHSKSGDVKGPLIYANYGSRDDFKRLYDSGIETKGAIALVRYGGTETDRALKIKAAELAGFAGCIIYSDPAEDGFTQGDVAPEGRFMPEGGVQRGGVSLMSWVVGDVLTPGWASTKGAKRISKEDSPGLVKIPSIPLSWGDAQHLLAAIQGFGQACPDEWKGAVPNVEYWSGNLSSPTVHLMNEQDENETQPIWNVMGKITGYEQREKSIVIGNHRDAWVYGATDPGSGTAVFLEVVHIFGDLIARGWRPLRTLEFASWDAEEYNLIGSTEYVERDLERLRKDGYVYLNVDVAVGGQEFHAAGSPIFRKSLLRVLDRTSDPFANATLRELWDRRDAKLEGLGAGSDYVAFQDMAGTSSLDFGFDGPPFPYHSAHDTYEWMASVGDPGFHYHKLMAQIWALMILEYCDRLVLPFDMSAYSASLTGWVMDLERWTASKGANQAGRPPFNTDALREAVLQFATDSRTFEKWEQEWDAVILASGGFESPVLAAHRQSHNNRMANFETHLLDLEEGGGIPNRTQFKHVIFGPQLWSGYDEAFFPAIRDAVEAEDWTLAQQLVNKTGALIKKASKKLIGN